MEREHTIPSFVVTEGGQELARKRGVLAGKPVGYGGDPAGGKEPAGAERELAPDILLSRQHSDRIRRTAMGRLREAHVERSGEADVEHQQDVLAGDVVDLRAQIGELEARPRGIAAA